MMRCGCKPPFLRHMEVMPFHRQRSGRLLLKKALPPLYIHQQQADVIVEVLAV